MATASKAKKSAPGKKAIAKKASGTKVQAKSDAASDLRELFEDELKDIYWAEKALTKAIPKMAKNAANISLKMGLMDHLAETQGQAVRLEQVFSMLGKKAQAKKCEAMAGILKEGDEILKGTQAGPVRDAGIIAACQKVEHYEIATYGTLETWANVLGEKAVAALLGATLQEEKKADQKLTEVAEKAVNIAAEEGD